MDINDIDFNEELKNDYVEALNSTFVRKDRVFCYCNLHHCYVSLKQSKRRKCTATKCKHFREPSFIS